MSKLFGYWKLVIGIYLYLVSRRLISLWLIIWLLIICSPLTAAPKWPGVDETVVEKYAQDHKRPAREPCVKLEGDMELFAFLSAGAIGGFLGGYFFRILMESKNEKK